ncbi:hypothetical protein NPX13_g3804 [Xylaria arbuscula]|uniref:Piwi domain-containing protein n=1 Tax=Xylaria arbuscula TaxID=114810 RepID=A0A9W8NH81_9PEZI|nr:hypothetical protein NPX13_g3804 [Xylaria arbuscula]
MSSRGRGGRGKRVGGNGGGRRQPAAGGDQPPPTQSGISDYVPKEGEYPYVGITSYENDYEKEVRAGGLNHLSLEEGFPWRPSYGTNGTPILLYANYCVFGRTKGYGDSALVLYTYEIKVEPRATSGKLKQIIRLFLQSPELAENRPYMVTDFAAILVATKRIAIDSKLDVEYRAEGEDEPRENPPIYEVKLTPRHEFCVGHVVKYLARAGEPQQVDTTPAIQALNILINYYAKSSNQVKTLGSAKNFSLANAETTNLGGGLKAYRGFFTSVRAATGRLLVNVNVCHSVFYDDKRLDILIGTFIRDSGVNLENHIGLEKLSRFVSKVRVQTTHLPEKRNRRGEVIPKFKTIYDLALPGDGRSKKQGEGLENPPIVPYPGAGATEVKFWLDRGETASATSTKKKHKPSSGTGGNYISVFDYFKNMYNITIRTPRLPVVNVGTREKPSYLPAECCIVPPGTPTKASLDPSQTKAMIDFAVRNPAANHKSITEKGLDNLGLRNDAFTLLKEFGVGVDSELVKVKGRVLTQPTVFYANKMSARVTDGSWNILRLKFSKGSRLQSWTCLYVGVPDTTTYRNVQDFSDEQLQGIVSTFHGVMISAGINAEKPRPSKKIKMTSPNDPQLKDEIRRYAAERLQLVLVVLPTDTTSIYSYLKQLADVEYGVHTVCTVGSKLARPRNDQYFRNVALKVNLKLGGNNQRVADQDLGILGGSQSDTMVVGIDVTHPSPGSAETARSRSAMVASIDSQLGQWPGVVRMQEGGLEMYRDGVSEGQYKAVLDQELPQLRKACRGLYPSTDQKSGFPRISIIICGKRHHTRLFVADKNDGDNSGNPPAGTVCDRGITELRVWDFYLQAHAAIKGTAKPCHYVVLLDEIFRSTFKNRPGNVADELQKLTLSLSYLFGRATRQSVTVRRHTTPISSVRDLDITTMKSTTRPRIPERRLRQRAYLAGQPASLLTRKAPLGRVRVDLSFVRRAGHAQSIGIWRTPCTTSSRLHQIQWLIIDIQAG